MILPSISGCCCHQRSTAHKLVSEMAAIRVSDAPGVSLMARSIAASRSARRVALSVLARLIQRIAEIPKRQLYNALNPRIDQVSRPPCPPDRREFRNVRAFWFPKPAAIRLSVS